MRLTKRTIHELLALVLTSLNAFMLGFEVQQLNVIGTILEALILAGLAVIYVWFRLHLRAYLFAIAYFILLGLMTSKILSFVFNPASALNQLQNLYSLYTELFIVVILFWPLYKLIVEKRSFPGKVIDKAQRFLIVEISQDPYVSIKPGYYAVECENTDKYSIGENVQLQIDIKGNLRVKE
jgi:hypothetical protein